MLCYQITSFTCGWLVRLAGQVFDTKVWFALGTDTQVVHMPILLKLLWKYHKMDGLICLVHYFLPYPLEYVPVSAQCHVYSIHLINTC